MRVFGSIMDLRVDLVYLCVTLSTVHMDGKYGHLRSLMQIEKINDELNNYIVYSNFI